MRVLLLCVGACAAVASLGWAARTPRPGAPTGGVPRPEDYGFSGLINSKLNDGLLLLQAADVDSDGDVDLVVVNNPKARIDFLLQRKPGEPMPDNAATRTSGRSVNEMVDEVHFGRDSFPTEQKVTSCAIADLNGDGKNDLVFVGDSGKLTVVYRNAAKNSFGERVRFDLDEPSNLTHAIRCGDVNGDGRVDVLVAGKKTTTILLQGADGKLTAATPLQNATGSPDGFALADFDGDKKLDLLFLKAESDAPVRCRLNRGNGDFASERLFPFTEIRAATVYDVDHDGRSEVCVVRRRSGRVALLGYSDKASSPKPGELALSAPRVVAFATQKDEKPREELLADLDGDGRPELLVAEPSAARVVVHRADPDGLACHGDAFPSLVGARHPCVADLDHDGKRELLVAAADEGAVGLSKVDEKGRIGFPETLGYKADQLFGLDVADVDGSGKPAIYAVLGRGKGAKKEYELARVAVGEPTQGANGAALTVKLDKLPNDPSDLWLVDLDRDGLRDAIVFVPTEMPRILLAKKSADGKLDFVPLETQDVPGLGLLKGVPKTALFHGDVDGDGKLELLVPGPNFARAFTLGAKGVPTVVAQWNLDDAGAKVGAVAAGDLDGDGKPEVLVTEKTTKTLRVLRLVDGAAKTVGQVQLGDLDPDGLRVADLDGNGAQDVVLLAATKFAVVQAGKVDPGFVELTDFETPMLNAFLDDVEFGDVNSDGIVDAVMTDTSQHRLAIAAHVDGALHHVLQFPIYEESIFERDGGGGKEPRELVIADLTNDGKLDVALLVHDRILVYPQE
jgi:hypothetical protein